MTSCISDAIIEKVCLIISNYNDVPYNDMNCFVEFIKQKPDYQSILKLTIAMHMKLYAEDENFDKLFILNGGAERNINKLVVMTAKRDIQTLIGEIEKYDKKGLELLQMFEA
jgi:hypothetical protein